MNSTPAVVVTEPSFRVSYQTLLTHNRDLAGKGTLVVRPDGFAFSGRLRGAGRTRSPHEVVLRPDQIANVQCAGTAVRFKTTVGRSAEADMPFVFWCETRAEAAAIVALLPAVQDMAAVEARNFAVKLQEVGGSIRGAASATNWLIGANLVAYVIMGLLGAGWIETASMKPYLLYAANNAAATGAGEWWRLVTAMFTHFGLLHLAFNMWALFQIGHLVEKLLGRVLFTTMYFGAGIAGGVATLLWHGDKMWSAGASGAIFGVYGALIAYLVREKQGMPRSVLQPMMKSTLTFTAYNLIFGAIYPHIDNVAHIGGLLGGFVLGWLFALPLDREARATRMNGRLALGAAFMAVVAGIGVAMTPRYDYRIQDELRWEEVIGPRAKEEQTLLDAGGRLFAAAAKSAGSAEADAVAWAKDKAAPFYEHWRAELAALPLTPGLRTAARRDALVHIIDLKVASYRELVAGEETKDARALNRFFMEQREISDELGKMSAK